MSVDPWESAAIVRQCRRCGQWKSISEFERRTQRPKDNRAYARHVCKQCAIGYVGRGNVGVVARGIRVTDKGRLAIEVMQAVA